MPRGARWCWPRALALARRLLLVALLDSYVACRSALRPAVAALTSPRLTSAALTPAVCCLTLVPTLVSTFVFTLVCVKSRLDVYDGDLVTAQQLSPSEGFWGLALLSSLAPTKSSPQVLTQVLPRRWQWSAPPTWLCEA